MTLGFPNASRSYDATRRAVRFWGSDGAMEASFVIEDDALRKMQPAIGSQEAEILIAFDALRSRINTVAARVYARGRQGIYFLSPADV
jgi:hypothetical protein